MVLDFNLNIKNMLKLFHKGRVDKIYEKIYSIAENLAIHDTEHYESRVYGEFMVKDKKNIVNDYTLKILKYRTERLEYHMNKMIELLKLAIDKEKDF